MTEFRGEHDGTPVDPGHHAAPPSAPHTAAREEAIRRRAYERYLSRGDGPGSDVDDWMAAEREVLRELLPDVPASESPAAAPGDGGSRGRDAVRALDGRDASAGTTGEAPEASRGDRSPWRQSSAAARRPRDTGGGGPEAPVT